MSPSCAKKWITASVVAVLAAGQLAPSRQGIGPRPAAAAEQEGEQEGKTLPPLIVDTDSPLLLNEAKKKAKPDKPLVPSVAENAACYVCHENFQEELLVKQHADGDVGCIDCHGKSYAHRNDENNTTPPDVMFPRPAIDASCAECHDEHNVPASQVIARLRERLPRVSSSQTVICTDCHGMHRLAHRTVVWDRATRELLTGKQTPPAPDKRPTLDLLRGLAGSWVQIGADGQPTDKVVSTYHVTAGGSAVIEVLFPGDEREMVTVYHQDGGELFLTHYCAAGNQPRMKCRTGSAPNQLVFEFVDATNMQSPQDQHMHAETLSILNSDRLRASWQAYSNGQPAESVEFDLVRKKG